MKVSAIHPNVLKPSHVERYPHGINYGESTYEHCMNQSLTVLYELNPHVSRRVIFTYTSSNNSKKLHIYPIEI